ncbi:hypothetical protein DFH08DRAFT_507734 [Mycena albidolilacea]|uniref:Uncharacterized protein n=1 Tax=Mycena albidolilacea TaxID=1033008 RepID=A0AAD7ADL0_9AGAR|nr:hypothetical protein DFH08DRAFT_507734 [Mycena albidolilacea]
MLFWTMFSWRSETRTLKRVCKLTVANSSVKVLGFAVILISLREVIHHLALSCRDSSTLHYLTPVYTVAATVASVYHIFRHKRHHGGQFIYHFLFHGPCSTRVPRLLRT